ncbi:hypothetical protein [Frankia sp. AgPm24]|uniref:DUF7715 family protein n=1 Tax=Frankia sp. AgPm24 TaxID=631128 RepID=UPI00200D2FC1|nr:hypothetical protein [Frankia sp. AgPm24]
MEGELVTLRAFCDLHLDRPHGRCECGRVFVGLGSYYGTTTAMVRHLPGITEDDYRDALCHSLDAQGWPAADAEAEATRLIAEVERWPVGAIIERFVDRLAIRALSDADIGRVPGRH